MIINTIQRLGMFFGKYIFKNICKNQKVPTHLYLIHVLTDGQKKGISDLLLPIAIL